MARYLGIEITDSQVKGVILKTAYKKLSLDGLMVVPRAQGPEGIRDATRAIADAAGPQLDGIYAAMGGTDVSLRVIELPRVIWRRGDKALQAELDGSVPFDVDDAIVASQVVTPGDPVKLLAAAVLTARVEALVHALAAGGCDPREVAVGPVALGELAGEIPELAIAGPVLLIYAYERRADLAILSDGVVRFARTLNGLTTPAARERSLRQTVASFVASGGAGPVVAYLCGEEAGMLASHVADACGLPASAVLPLPEGQFQSTGTPEESPLWHAPLAVALAARGLGRSGRIDLRKGSLAVGGSGQVFRERAPMLAAAAVFIVMFWAMATLARYRGLVAERNRLQDTLGAVTHEVFGREITDAETASALANGRLGQEEVDPLPLSDAFDVVGVLSARIPTNIRHDVEQLDINNEHIQIQGVVNTLQDRDHVVEALSGYDCFPTVRPGRVTTNPGDNRQKYTLDIEMRCPEQTARERRNTNEGGSNGASGNGTNASGGGTRGSNS